MNSDVRDAVLRRGITRLCHFTPSRNLVHIITDPRGLLASAHLSADERAAFNPTDSGRWDGHPGHLCCSVQYPNPWYFRKAKDKDRLFKDWVVVLIDPKHIWRDGTRFCPRNAAAGAGRYIADGVAGFEGMFAARVAGSGTTYSRTAQFRPWQTTDQQAEVLVPDQVDRVDLLGLVVCDEEQAAREVARAKILESPIPPITVAPAFFDAYGLCGLLRSGGVPDELPFEKE